MRFVSADHQGRRFAGVVEGDAVHPLRGIAELGRDTPSAVLRSASREAAIPLAEVHLRPVVPDPRKIVCIGSNYHAHVTEMGREVSDYPVLFPKYATALIGPYDAIVRPRETSQMDYEAEVAVVIGEHVRRVSVESALEAVAGYTVANDVSMRDFQYRTHQWLAGKAWEGSTPLGPALVTPDEVDPRNLDIRLTLNGETLQQSNTSLLIFDVATMISVVSEFTSLEPGDVLLTGTPGGVGVKREPQVFLESGDVVAVEVGGVGRIENLVRDES